MTRQVLVTAAILGSLALVACEDGPKQTYTPPPSNASSYWNNGRSAPDGGAATVPAGTATSATNAFAPDGGGSSSGGNNSVLICTPTQQQTRWSAMVLDEIRPPNVGGGLDMAGFTENPAPMPTPPNGALCNTTMSDPLCPGWAPGDVESWKGITIEQAESINCQGTDIGTYFGGTNEFAVGWGGANEVVLDSYVSNHLGFYLGLNFGYLGEVDFGCTAAACGATNANAKFKLKLDGTAIQYAQDGTHFVQWGAQLANGTVDWVSAAAGDATAILPFDEMFRALVATFTSNPPELAGITCNQTNACQIETFPGGGGICNNGSIAPGAVFFVQPLQWDFWITPYTTPAGAATACRMDIYLEQSMPFSPLNAVLKLDATGPQSQSAQLGVNIPSGPACQIELGMTYADFLANCVQTDATASDNQGELNKLFTGLTHDNETFFFNVPGIDMSFSAGSSLGPTQVVLDTSVPDPTDIGTEFNIDQNTAGYLMNDWNFNANPPVNHVQGGGAMYNQFKRIAITNIYKALGKPIPGGSVEALIAACILPRNATDGNPEWPVGADSVDPVAWAAQKQTAGCTGLEGLMTALQTTTDNMPLAADGSNANNNDPTNLGMLDTALISGGLLPPTTLPAALVTLISAGYALGMKPGTQVGTFCDDCLSAAGTTAFYLQTASVPPASVCFQGSVAYPMTAAQCSGALLPEAIAMVVATLGRGSVSNLPDTIQDNRFFFQQFGEAMIQVLEQTNADGSLKSQPITWGTNGVDIGDGVTPTAAPISFNDLFFDSIGSGQFTSFEYVDRRFVCGSGADTCANPVPATDITFSADVKDGIMSAYDIWRYYYRAEDLVYEAIQAPGFALGKESNELVTNVFGSPLLPTVWSTYACSVTSSTDAASLPTTTCSGDLDCGISGVNPCSCDSAGGTTCPSGQTGMCSVTCAGAPFSDSYGPLTTVEGIPLDFTQYQGAWNPTSLSLSYAGLTSPITVTQTVPATPAGGTGTIATQAMVQIPLLTNPYDPTTQTGVDAKLAYYTPSLPGQGFPMAVYGQSQLDQWIQASTLGFSGITSSYNFYYNMVSAPTSMNPSATALSLLAINSSDFLGDVFMCFIPTATLHGVSQPFLTARMFTSVALIVDWLNENPQAYLNTAPGCGVVVRWSAYNNYVDLIDVTDEGVRIDTTQGGGFGRVVGIQLYVPGQAAEE